MDRRERWLAGGALVLALGLAAACLPDLGPLLPAIEPVEPPPLRVCGDGVIASLEDGGDAGEACDPGDAQAPGCTACRVTCSGSIDDAGDHCYFVLTPTRDYVTARRQCVGAGAHLVTFASEREAQHVDALDAGAHWVGLIIRNDLGSNYGPPIDIEPGWPGPKSSVPCTGCFGRGADAGVFPVLPDVDAATDLFCVASDNRTWFQVPCSDGTRDFAVVCEREPVGTRAEFCNGPYCTNLPATAGRKTYSISQTPVTSAVAASLCAQRQDRLVVLESHEEREQLVHELRALLSTPTAPAFTAWIGLARNESGAWTWENGQPEAARPLQWASGQPSPQAATASRAYLSVDDTLFDTQLAFAETDESVVRPYVCEHTVAP